MPGHIESRCDSRQELEDKEKYGKYYNDIREGRMGYLQTAKKTNGGDNKPGGATPDEGDRNKNRVEEITANDTPDDTKEAPELKQNKKNKKISPFLL